MVVMVLERVSASLRGELSRWMIEPHAGVFLGDLSASVRDRLWDRCVKKAGDGAVIQAWSSNNEQGFVARSAGKTGRALVDYEGLLLVRIRANEAGDVETK